MLRSLFTAATGAGSQQFNIDVIANNVSNVNTTGYKRVRAEFQDLLSQTFSVPGSLGDQGTVDPIGIQVGLGTRVSATPANLPSWVYGFKLETLWIWRFKAMDFFRFS